MRKTYYYIAGSIVAVLLAVTAVAAVVRIYNSKENDEIIIDSKQTVEDTEVFYLILNKDTVTIYTDEMTIYDYAKLNVNEMPKDVINGLLEGFYITGKENLYNFLQAYSS